jgi:HD-GYP domain-containing protein (c-di-GMP phosphodiesterase class II)
MRRALIFLRGMGDKRMGVLSLLKNHLPKSAPEALPSHVERPVPTLVEDPRIKAAMESIKSHPEINRLLSLLWYKDPDTYNHCHRVADWAQWAGSHLGLSIQERVELYISGLLHDVGKLMTPNEILKKPGPLSNTEFAVMKLHSTDSGNVIRRVGDLGYLEPAIRGHHERVDGRGYPDGIRGDKIHVFSKVILVADTFDAMTSDRVYRKGLDPAQAYDELVRFSGTQFDPDAARSFIKGHETLALPAAPAIIVPNKKAA